jgi:hypothetical protein
MNSISHSSNSEATRKATATEADTPTATHTPFKKFN